LVARAYFVSPMQKRRVLLGFAGTVACMLALSACESVGREKTSGGLTRPTPGAGARTVAEARKSIEAGDTTIVIPRLLHVISNSPESKNAMDARYWLGVAYMKIDSYRDAMDMFQEYQRLAPEGAYAAQASDHLGQLKRIYDEKYQTAEEMNAEVRVLADKVAADPSDTELNMQFAETLWKRGDYDSAAAIYYRVIRQDPALARDPRVSGKVEQLASGEFIVLTPSEVQRREVERQPLWVFNTASFKSGKDLLTREPLYFAVTGQVVNRGASVLYGAQVVITIYAFGNMVYDTNTVHIGRLNPGEVRAFSARFSNFDNIDEVNRYDCVATFDR